MAARFIEGLTVRIDDRRLKTWASALKRDVVALWLAARDPRTPWLVRLVAGLVAAYALSPVDLIPDFIPVVGYLDDLVIVPLGIRLVVALMPPALLDEFRREAERRAQRPSSPAGAIAIVFVWIAVLGTVGWWIGTRLLA